MEGRGSCFEGLGGEGLGWFEAAETKDGETDGVEGTGGGVGAADDT